MSKQARYTIGVPVQDNLGNPLEDISTKLHEMLHKKAVVQGSYITGPHRSNWEQDRQEPIEHFVTVLDDTPENDMHIKEAAGYVAQAANQWGVHCMKDGAQGIQSWVVKNAHYQKDFPAPLSKPRTTAPFPAMNHYTGSQALR